MKFQPHFKKTVLCISIGAMLTSPVVMASPLSFVQAPAGEADKTPAPNVIISIDDSGSMAWDPFSTNNPTGGNPSRMDILKAALSSVFADTSLLPDGSIRLAWQAMWNNGNSPGAATLTPGALNSMKVLDTTHRANFQSFVNSLRPRNGTPSHNMMRQADAYMRNGLIGVNSPWASIPGPSGTATPYLGCRRSYHIFMTDGRWNTQNGPGNDIGNIDGTNVSALPDGTPYNTADPFTRIYQDRFRTNLADWAFRSWSQDLVPTLANDIKPSTDYNDAPASEVIGGIAVPKFWNPRYNPATWQHLVTYSIGYSQQAITWAAPISNPSSSLPFGYDGDFPRLVNGAESWPDLDFYGRNENNRSLDLWHSAINGRGQFYAVSQNSDLTLAFRSIIQRINDENSSSITGVGAGGSSNMYEDVGIYSAGYDASKNWSGYVYSDTYKSNGSIGPNAAWGVTGNPAPNDHITTADKLDAPSFDIDQRFILTARDDNPTTPGVEFRWDSTGAAYMSLAQNALLQPLDTLGEDRVKFLRGDRTKEVDNSGPFRNRSSRQGDIVNSGVWYTPAPSSNYSFLGYKEFRQARAARSPMIYVGGNDGMLHGFKAEDGTEKIAYVPKGVISKLPELTSPDYSHKYYVDNTPFTGDVNLNPTAATALATNWKTMLVGTLGAGGRGYFVLDVTRPDSAFVPALAADLVIADNTFSSTDTPAPASVEADIGHIFAAPVVHDTNALMPTQITLMNNNRWAVVLGNGYNSMNERPVLLVQFMDGLRELTTIVATGVTAPKSDENTTANGLSSPRVVDLNADGTTDVVYAGDLKGNMWKFDLTSPDPAQWKMAFGGIPLYTAVNASKRQPITAPPSVKANDRGVTGMMVAFTTGRNLTLDDRTDESQQSVYSVLDNTSYCKRSAPDEKKVEVHPGGTTCPNGNTTSNKDVPTPVGTGTTMLLEQTVGASSAGSGSNAGRTFWNLSTNTIDWATQKGWFINLPATRERGLKAMPFYDSSNILAVFTQVPAVGTSATGAEESCTATVSQEKQYMTLLNIMDGKPPSIPVMNRNGDAYYNSADGAVSRVTLGAGATTIVSSQDAIRVFSGGGNTDDPNAKALDNRPMPETPIRPSWRQMQ
ncbi:MAG: pilus assembly protein [Shewanella algae]